MFGMVPFIIAFRDVHTAVGLGDDAGRESGAARRGAALLAGRTEECWFLVPILLLVGTATGVVRVLEQRGAEHRELGGHSLRSKNRMASFVTLSRWRTSGSWSSHGSR